MSKNITELLNKIKTYVDTKDASHESDANEYTDAKIRDLNASLGDGTKLISTITETEGKLSAYTGPTILSTINTTDNIPTSNAVKTYADSINTDLQNQINNLKSVQNVVDVKNSFSQLTTELAESLDIDDKVQVIADEHAYIVNPIYTEADRPTSIYKVIANGASRAWDYVGTFGGDSYTKTETNALLNNKADKIATVSTVAYDAAHKKFTKTINAVTTDVVTIATLKNDLALDHVENKSAADLKSEFTGTIAANDTRFATGDAVYQQLNLKANQATTYTKTEVDALIGAANADIADINEFLDDTPLDVDYVVKEDPTTHVGVKGLYKTGRDTTAYSLIVDLTTLKTDLALNNVTNDRQVKGLASGATENHILVFGADGYTIKDSGKTLEDTGKVDTISIDGTNIPADANKNIDLPAYPTATSLGLDQKEDIANKTAVWTDTNDQSFIDDIHYPTTKLMYNTLEEMNENFEELIESATNIIETPIINSSSGNNAGVLTPEQYAKINARTIIKVYSPEAHEHGIDTDFYFYYAGKFLNTSLVFNTVYGENIISLVVNTTPISASDLDPDDPSDDQYEGCYQWVTQVVASNLDKVAHVNEANEFSDTNVFKNTTEFDRTMTVKSALDLSTDGYIKGGYISSSITGVLYTASTPLDDIADAIWNAKKDYAIGDIIFYNRALYICTHAILAKSSGNPNPTEPYETNPDVYYWTRLFTPQA